MLPIGAIEPGLEPYLTSAPFNMSVPQVGLCLLIISVVDVLGAIFTSPVSALIGQIPLFFVGNGMLILSLFSLAFGPQTWLSVQLAFAPQSLGQLPAMVMTPAFMFRVCRTYGLDPKAYTEIITAMMAGLMAPVVGVFAAISGVVIDSIGFRNWYMILGIICCSGPPVMAWGFNARVMGKPLAPEASETTDAEYASQQQAKLKQEDQQKAAQA